MYFLPRFTSLHLCLSPSPHSPISLYAVLSTAPLRLSYSQGVGMANKGPSFGLSRQVQDKIDSKYDPDLEQILVEWICRQCGSGVGRPEAGKVGFQAWLKDGCVSATVGSLVFPRHHDMLRLMIRLMPLPLCHLLYRLSLDLVCTGSERANKQSVCRKQTCEEDRKLIHGLQTDGANLPVPHCCRELWCHQD